MAINYGLLKESENEIMIEFKEFYSFVIGINTKLYEYLQDDVESLRSISEEQLEIINDLVKKAEITQGDLLANCIWLIQKNEPRASHLRFIIAIIYSIKNLLNVCESTLKLAKFFSKIQINVDLFKEFLNAHKLTIELSKKIADSLSERDPNIIQQNLKNDFENYHQEIKTLIRKCAYIHDDNLYKDNKDLINFIINLGRLERIIDRQENILHDFAYIK